MAVSLEASFIELAMGALGATRLGLADVGASGGIADRWSAFGERLWAIGFDPLVREIERLQQVEVRPNVKYESAFVGWPELERRLSGGVPGLPADTSSEIQPYERSSAVAAHRILNQDYARDVFNRGVALEYSDRHISLDDYFRGQPGPDFIKIDTDGSDYPVILGSRQLLEQGVLGLEVEMQFHGPTHEYANTFANIDICLRRLGFSLFDLSPYRYTRSALPGPFLYDLAAQTSEGQVVWADAVYFRDLAHAGYDAAFAFVATRESVLKLCCLFVLFGLRDCAAELLARHPAVRDVPQRTALLDLITPRTLGCSSYDAYMERFTADPGALLPSRLAAARGRGPADGVEFGLSRPAAVVPNACALESLSATTWHGSLVPHPDGVKLTTSPIPWSYAAGIALSRSVVSSPGPFCLRVELRVDRGRIGIGALDLEGGRFLSERQISAQPRFVIVDIDISSLDDVSQLIVRNAAEDGIASEAVVRSIALYEPA